MTHSEQINELAAALAKAQGRMKPAVKDASNPHYKSKYADLAANAEAARAPLAENGIAVVQEPVTVEKGISVATMLMHSSGQWIKFEPLTVPMAKIDAHGAGSATTYARRYALGAVLQIVADDDDGNAAVSSQPAPRAVAPAGYDDWRDDLAAVAESGTEALQKAWKESKAEYRTYLTSTNPEAWEALKKLAAGKKAA